MPDFVEDVFVGCVSLVKFIETQADSKTSEVLHFVHWDNVDTHVGRLVRLDDDNRIVCKGQHPQVSLALGMKRIK